MKIIFISFFLMFSTITHSAIYQSIDSKGQLTFTDQASSKNSPFKYLPARNTYQASSSSPTISAKSKNTRNSNVPTHVNTAFDVKPEQSFVESDFSINIPAEGQNFWNQRQIPIEISLSPQRRETYRIQLIFDGLQYQQPQHQTKFFIDNPTPGMHKLQAHLLNSNGEMIQSSQIITIYIHYGTLQTQRTSATHSTTNPLVQEKPPDA